MELRIENQTITADLPVIVSDSIEFVSLQFVFDDTWEHLTKVAQFTQGPVTYNVALENDGCYLPREIINGPLHISVFGQSSDSAVRATTAPLTIAVRKAGFVSDGKTPIPPTPDLYSQLLGFIDFGVDGDDGASAYEIAVANGFEGDEATWLLSLVGETGATGAQGEKGDTGEMGMTSLFSVDIVGDDLILSYSTEELDVSLSIVGTNLMLEV